MSGGPGGPLNLLHADFWQRRFAPHIHEEFAIGASTGGVEAIDYRGAVHHARTGDVVVLGPEEPHTGGPASPGDGYSYRALYPPTHLLAENADRPWRPHFVEPVVRDPQLARELAAVHTLLSGRGDALEAEARLINALDTLVTRHATTPPPRSTRRDAALTRALAGRLTDQLADPPTLAELAADTGRSRYQILRAFRRDLGMPPYQWLAQHRVHRARVLIDAGSSPAEAAALVGFADQAHLTRWFRRVLGVTPGTYRNSVQDGGGVRSRSCLHEQERLAALRGHERDLGHPLPSDQGRG